MIRRVIAILGFLSAVLLAKAQSAESDAAFNRGIDLFRTGDFAQAARFFEQADALDRVQLDTLTSSRWAYSRDWAAHCYYRLGDKAKARSINKYGYEIEPVDRRLSVASDRLAEKAYKCFEKGDYDGAIKNGEKTLAEEIRLLGEENLNVAGSYCLLSDYYSNYGDMAIAYNYINKALVLIKKLSPPGELSLYYCNVGRLANILLEYTLTTPQDRDECYKMLKDASEYFSACGNIYEAEYIGSLILISEYAMMLDQIDEAESVQQKLVAIWDDFPSEKRIDFPVILRSRLNYYVQLSQVDASRTPSPETIENLIGEFISTIKDANGEYTEAYVDALLTIANAKTTFGMYRDSSTDYERAIRLLKFLYGDQEMPVYASIYFAMCCNALNFGEPNTAISYGNEALRLAQYFYPTDALFQANIYRSLSNCYIAKQQPQRALELNEKGVKVLEDAGKTDFPIYNDVLLSYADRLTNCNRREEALTIVERVISNLQARNELRSTTYITAITGRLNLLDALNRHDEATEARRRELARSSDFGEYADFFSHQIRYNEAMSLYNAKNYDESLELCDKIIDEYTGNTWFSPYTALRLKASNLQAQHRISEAIAVYDEILQSATDEDRKTSTYADILKDKALAYISTGNNSAAETTIQPAFEIYRNVYGEYSPQYVETINGIANIMIETGVIDAAEKYNSEAMRILSKGIGENTRPYLAFAQLCEAKIAFFKGNYEETISRANQVIAGFENLSSGYNQPVGNAYMLIGDSHLHLANYRAADEAYENALVKFANPNGSRYNLDCALIFNSLSTLHQKMGNMEESGSYKNLASEIFIRLSPKESLQYGFALMYKSQQAITDGNADEARAYFDELDKLFADRIGDKSKLKYTFGLIRLYFEAENGPSDELRASVRKFYDEIKKDDFYSADVHPNLIQLLFNLEMYDKALDVARFSESKIHNIYGRTSPQAVEIYYRLADIYKKQNKIGKALEYLNKTFTTGRDVLLGAFTTMTQSERSNFWNNYFPLFRQGLPYACYTNLSLKDITKTTYNATLLGTGILLEAERNLSDMIARNGSESLRALYDSFRSTKTQFNHISSQLQNLSGEDLMDASIQANNLNKEMTDMERNLLAQVATELGDFTSTLRIEWTDVRSALKKSDIAIEFIEFYDNDSIVTAALCLKKDFKEPTFLKLFARAASDTDFADDCYLDLSLSQKIWGTLAPTVADADNIYFSTQGALCNVAIESMPMEGIIAEPRRRRFHRLSSTRELALNRKAPASNEAVLFGGLNYDMTLDEMKADSIHYPGAKRSGTLFANGLRGSVGIPPLPGTLKEIEQIGKALSNSAKTDFKVDLVHGNLGTETSFKQLSGRKKRIIHIGTHGYYVSVDDIAGDDILMRMFGEYSGDNRSREEKILSRSGLYFAGAANNYKENLSAIDGLLDDGVLTAQEISTLDFSDLDMIVLSACETARGDLSGDGVFGLQRGFKKAGASSILMSLWKVDDNATQMLMSEFYRNLADGKSKYESLELAKDLLKAHSRYNDPDYWAAFILLDALN